jgi:hypothetical protein
MQNHNFHIPVMGIAYTIDTPLRVSHFGINSVISLLDDVLLEKLRKVFTKQYNHPYQEIKANDLDSRANRITAYLNLINKISEEKFHALKNCSVGDFKKYLNLLPENSPIKIEFKQLSLKNFSFDNIREKIKEKFSRGNIDVNIMTKVDKEHYDEDGLMPAEFNDAHAALRGFANSELSSSVVFSAGMNPKLFSYIEKFKDFFPDVNMNLKKKITLKVSDFRSAFIQGKMLANKGLWVSEYRIESGLNCGGHAFATDGHLLGPVLEQFKEKRDELIRSLHTIFTQALQKKSLPVPEKALNVKVSAQGGVGTSEEHKFLLKTYNLDSIGWGTPFLLVPEAVCVDNETIRLLEHADADDLFLSDISPLGVPFNNLRGNTKDEEKFRRIADNKPGSPCPRKYVALNKEFSDKGICSASRHYQKLKIKQLDAKDLHPDEYQKEYKKIVEKSCICVGLGTSAMINYGIPHASEGVGVSVCPGPNMAFFNREMSLLEIVNHIYGKTNAFENEKRPHVFLNELQIYILYLKNEIAKKEIPIALKDLIYFRKFADNLLSGIDYYKALFPKIYAGNPLKLNAIQQDLNQCVEEINCLV